jgi:hypothetical protein
MIVKQLIKILVKSKQAGNIFNGDHNLCSELWCLMPDIESNNRRIMLKYVCMYSYLAQICMYVFVSCSNMYVCIRILLKYVCMYSYLAQICMYVFVSCSNMYVFSTERLQKKGHLDFGNCQSQNRFLS